MSFPNHGWRSHHRLFLPAGIVFFWISISLWRPAVSGFDGLFYGGFARAGGDFSLDGAAEIDGKGVLRLTDDTPGTKGHAFYSRPIRFKTSPNATAVSFSTSFAFSIVTKRPNHGGHGLAFVISSAPALPAAHPGQFLGLLGYTYNRNSSNRLFAVEFDTVKNVEFRENNENHVGIDINSMISRATVAAADGSAPRRSLDLKSGGRISAWIHYDSAEKQLNVTLWPSFVRPNRSILSFDVDLSSVLDERMYVGFSASTSVLASSHYILGWSFNTTGAARDLNLASLPSLPTPKKSRETLILAATVSPILAVLVSIRISVYAIRRFKNADAIEDWELGVGPHRFSYQQLKRATKGFREKELLGFGGFGRVYRGTLPNSGAQIAVKRISPESTQGLREFASEITSIGRLRHRNLVQLLGWCRRRGDLLLVYEFMPNGSLDSFLFNEPKSVLIWEQRFKIIKGVASGLLYLHEGWEQTVIHRDIKAGNVLLDSDLNGRLGDFGLAKLHEHGGSPCTTRVVGTLGYLAPELSRYGKPTASSDVYAFGAVLLEVVCGRRPIEHKAQPEEMVLVDVVREKWKVGTILDVVDPRLGGNFDEAEAVATLRLALVCSSDWPETRPTMRQVVSYLDGQTMLPQEVPGPAPTTAEMTARAEAAARLGFL